MEDVETDCESTGEMLEDDAIAAVSKVHPAEAKAWLNVQVWPKGWKGQAKELLLLAGD